MKNKRLALGFLAATLLLAPSPAAAWRPYGPPRHSYYSYGTSYHHHHSNEVAIGVLSGIVGGVILDRIFNPPVVVQAPPYYPPSDPYSTGYAAGYERGTRKAERHRYRDAYRRGYEEGFYSGRAGY